jgi:hypothetical protein
VWGGAVETAQISGASGATPRPAQRKAFRAKLHSIGDVQSQLARLYREARSGTIRVEDASRLANILAILGRMIADSDLETRIAALETKATRQ